MALSISSECTYLQVNLGVCLAHTENTLNLMDCDQDATDYIHPHYPQVEINIFKLNAMSKELDSL